MSRNTEWRYGSKTGEQGKRKQRQRLLLVLGHLRLSDIKPVEWLPTISIPENNLTLWETLLEIPWSVYPENEPQLLFHSLLNTRGTFSVFSVRLAYHQYGCFYSNYLNRKRLAQQKSRITCAWLKISPLLYSLHHMSSCIVCLVLPLRSGHPGFSSALKSQEFRFKSESGNEVVFSLFTKTSRGSEKWCHRWSP